MVDAALLKFADEIAEIMAVIMKEFARRQAKELFKSKVTLSQLLILNFLHYSGEPRMTELAKFMKVTTAAMTGIVDRLVRDGYVHRIYDPKDRRIIKIKLTAKGSNLVEKALQQRRNMFIEIFGKISEGERRDYLRILKHIREILIAEQKEK